eukprot:gene3536-4177_t
MVSETFKGYHAWSNRDSIVIMSRPGIAVNISSSDSAIGAAAGALADEFALKAGKIVKTAYGEGRILGAKNNQLWYCCDGAEQSAWYWRSGELKELLEAGTIKFDVEPSAAALAAAAYLQVGSASPTKADSVPEALSLEAFSEGLRDSSWTRSDDENICRVINALANKYDIDPLRISANDIELHIVKAGLLPGKSSVA